MSTVVGKFAGGGLIVAAALLIWLYAAGGFSPVVAQTAPSIQRTFDEDVGGTWGYVGVSLSRRRDYNSATVTETLPGDLDVSKVARSISRRATQDGLDIKFTLVGTDSSNIYTVMVPMTASKLATTYDVRRHRRMP